MVDASPSCLKAEAKMDTFHKFPYLLFLVSVWHFDFDRNSGYP